MFNPLFRIKSVLITTRTSDPQGFILEDLITSFCLAYEGADGDELQTKQFSFLRLRIVIIRSRPYALPIP